MEVYERLEAAINEWAGTVNAVACAAGTAALHLGLEALRLPQGLEVVCPDFTMIAVPRAVTLAGLVPVFVDCGEDLNLDPELVEEAIGDDTVAVMAVHTYGRRCKTEAVHEAAAKHGLAVIEDMAEIHGVRPDDRTAAACWSFYRNKIVCCVDGEGGAVAFPSRGPGSATLARMLRSLGFTDAHDFTHVPRGHNYRLSNAHAGAILDSLRNVQANLRERRRIEQCYDAACPPEWRMPPRSAVWVYDLRVPGMTRSRQMLIVRQLQVNGIAARNAFRPMHEQEEYRHCRRVGGEVAGRMSDEVFYLPVQPGVTTPEDCRRAFEVIRSCLP